MAEEHFHSRRWASRNRVKTGRRLAFEALEDRRLLAILTVNTLVDENNGIGVGGVSLREAVAAAAPGDTINFSVTGTINLTNTGDGHIQIDKGLTIQGPGANLLTVKAFDTDGLQNSTGRRVFLVDDGAASFANVSISGLTLSGGDPVVLDENGGGGAIVNHENVSLSACVLSGNFGPNGGAIENVDGALAINDCTISGNRAQDGGACVVQGGSLTITRSTIANNQVTNSGGAIFAQSRSVTIMDSTVSGNFANESGGGFYEYHGSLSISGTTISGNAADADHDTIGSGGGIFNMGGSLSVVDSTISGNSAGAGGAGIYSNTGQSITVAHSTVTGNVIPVGVFGGGINSLGVAVLDHTIVAGNLMGASTREDVAGTFNASYSLIGDKRSAAVSNLGGSQIGTTAAPIDAKLGPLANNGGPTLTHALLAGSPALEAGNPAAVAGAGGVPQYDQRGMPYSRVVDYDGVGGARIDIGAIEMTPPVQMPALPGDYNLNHVVDAADYVLWRKTLGNNVQPAYSGADGDGNNVVNSNDYTVWRSNFGGTTLESETAVEVSVAATDPMNEVVEIGGGADAVAFVSAAQVLSSDASQSPSIVVPPEATTAKNDWAIELLLTAKLKRTDMDRSVSDCAPRRIWIRQ